MWFAVNAALLLLVLLIVFILQNPTKVEAQFLGIAGTLPLEMAMLIMESFTGVFYSAGTIGGTRGSR